MDSVNTEAFCVIGERLQRRCMYLLPDGDLPQGKSINVVVLPPVVGKLLLKSR
jgi:hypothetical protein